MLEFACTVHTRSCEISNVYKSNCQINAFGHDIVSVKLKTQKNQKSE